MIHTITITVHQRAQIIKEVNALLSQYGESIHLRVGHPFRERDLSVIFLIVEMNTDDLGAFSGKLGQLPGVQVKSISIKDKS